MNIVFYDVDGKIERVVGAGSQENIDANIGDVANYVLTEKTVSRKTHLVSNNTVLLRPTLPISQSDKTLSGIPSGSTLTIMGRHTGMQTATADGTDITISPDIPGIYTVKVEKWPYQEEEFTIEHNG